MDDAERIDREVADRGGLRVFDGLFDEEIAEWKLQALVLSYFREAADLDKACVLAGVPFAVVHDWLLNDKLNFKGRESEVRVQAARQLEATLFEQLKSGTQKSPGLWRMMLERLDPETWVKRNTEDTPEGLKFMRELRERNQAEREAAMAAPPPAPVEQSQEEEPEEEADVFTFRKLSLRDRVN